MTHPLVKDELMDRALTHCSCVEFGSYQLHEHPDVLNAVTAHANRSVKAIKLRDCGLENVELAILLQSQSIETLTLHEHKIDEVAFMHLGKAKRLTSLDVNAYFITNEGLQQLAQTRSLTHLTFHSSSTRSYAYKGHTEYENLIKAPLLTQASLLGIPSLR
jgi:hypothetical protein